MEGAAGRVGRRRSVRVVLVGRHSGAGFSVNEVRARRSPHPMELCEGEISGNTVCANAPSLTPFRPYAMTREMRWIGL